MTRQPSVQPDLFGEFDASEERAKLWNLPQTCPRCGRHEPNGLQLSNNHGIEPGTDTIGGFDRDSHPTLGELCMAQWLVRNHIIHDIQTGNDDALIRDAERGRELRLDVAGIMLAAVQEAS